MSRRVLFAVALSTTSLVSCSDTTGSMGGDTRLGRGGSGGGTGPGDATDIDRELVAAIAPMPLRRLTRREFNNSVRDLFGDSTRPGMALVADDVGSFGFRQAVNTSPLMVTSLQETAESVAAKAASHLEDLLSCTTKGDDPCAESFMVDFGRKVFRRPLAQEEIEDLQVVYQAARRELKHDFRNAIRLVITAMLQSPQFLYHFELGPERAVAQDGIVKLNPFEMASRLSFLFWGSTPDETLLDAAASGELSNANGLEAQAKRLWDDPRGRAIASDFFSQLLQLDAVVIADKDRSTYPEWNETRNAAYDEGIAFVENVLFDGDGELQTLLTSTATLGVDARLAKLYGVLASTTESPTVQLPPERAGILTSVAFLASHSGPAEGALITPISRGKAIRTRLLCQDIPPPAADITSVISTGATVRERLSSHTTDPQCASCHAMMDSLGFALGKFDGIGRYRDRENGHPIDTTGLVTETDGEPAFDGAAQLARVLSEAPEAKDCVIRNQLRYSLNRNEEPNESDAFRRLLGARSSNLREIFLAIARSPAFLNRTLSEGEVSR